MSGPCRATSDSPQKETRGLLFGGPMETMYVLQMGPKYTIYMHMCHVCTIHCVWGPVCIL